MMITSNPMSFLPSEQPAGAYDKHLEQVLPLAREQPGWIPSAPQSAATFTIFSICRYDALGVAGPMWKDSSA